MDDNDVSSNPMAADHLPVGGEVEDEYGGTSANPDISDDMDLDNQDTDAPKVS